MQENCLLSNKKILIFEFTFQVSDLRGSSIIGGSYNMSFTLFAQKDLLIREGIYVHVYFHIDMIIEKTCFFTNQKRKISSVEIF